MLILLSVLGSMLATIARKTYLKLCCRAESKTNQSPTVGYQKAPSSPSCASQKHYYKSYEDTASIQINANNHNCKYVDHQEVPKRAILATVRSSHTRGRCRQGPVRQMLADPPQHCPTHSTSSTPVKSRLIMNASDVEEADDPDENDHVLV